MMNSEEFNDMTVDEAREAISDMLVKKGIGRRKYYRLFRWTKIDI